MMKSKSAARLLSPGSRSPVSAVESQRGDSYKSGAFSVRMQKLHAALRMHSESPESARNEVTHLFEELKRLAACQKDVPAALADLCQATEVPAAHSLGLAADAQAALGDAYLSAHHYQEAAESLHKAVSLATSSGPELFQVYNRLCEAYFRMEKHKQAIRFGTQAAIYADQLPASHFPALNTQLPKLFDFLSRAEVALKRFDRAKFWLKRSLVQLQMNVEMTPRRRKQISHRGIRGLLRSSVDLTLKPGDVTADTTQKDSLIPLISKTRSPDHRCDKYIPLTGPRKLSGSLLYECWKRLKIGSFAHISISQGVKDTWLVRVTCNRMDVREQLNPLHPWRTIEPAVLAAHLQLNKNRELYLEVTKSNSAFSIELHRETREFEDGAYELIFRTESELREIEVTAESPSLCLTKKIVNDLNLPSREACRTYVLECLLPVIQVTNGRIVIKIDRSPASALPSTLRSDQSPRPLSTCNSTRNSPQSFAVCPTSEAALTRRRYMRHHREEIYTVQQTGNPQQEGFIIRFSETESGNQEYKRDYQHLRTTSRDHSLASQLRAAITIQAFIRKTLTRREFKLRKSFHLRKRPEHRLGVRLKGKWFTVNVYWLHRERLIVHMCDADSKEVTSAEFKAQLVDSRLAFAALLTQHESELVRD